MHEERRVLSVCLFSIDVLEGYYHGGEASFIRCCIGGSH